MTDFDAHANETPAEGNAARDTGEACTPLQGLNIDEKVEFLMDTLPASECKCEIIAERIGESADLVALWMLVILSKRKDAKSAEPPGRECAPAHTTQETNQMRQVREITQLYLWDIIDATETETETEKLRGTLPCGAQLSTCAECGDTFDAQHLNHYRFCEDCLDRLQSLADLNHERQAHTDRKNGYEPETDAYEAELMALPGTRRRAALDGFRG